MQKQIELLSLDNENTFDNAYSLYETLFTQLTQEEASFIRLSSTKPFFTTLAQKINTSDLIILAVQKSSYVKTKDMLFRALKINTDVNSALLTRLMNSGSKSLLAHSTMPIDAKVISTKNGEYSGFIHIIGKKAIMFLPLDDEISVEIEKELREFYLPQSDKSQEPEIKSEDKKDEIPPEEPKSKKEKKKQNKENKKSQRAKLKAEKKKQKVESIENDDAVLTSLMNPKTAIKKMKRDNISVAVSSSRYSDFVFSILNEDTGVIYPYPTIDESEEVPSKKELASIASKSRKNCDSTLGVSISDVFYSKDKDERYYIYICIADDEQAHILKFNSMKSENAKDFLHYTALCFFSVLGHFADTGVIAIPQKRLPMINEGRPVKKSSYKNTFFLTPVISAVLCISLLFCTNIYSSTQAAMAATLGTTSSFVPVNLGGYDLPPDYDDIPLTPQEQEELSEESSGITQSESQDTELSDTQKDTIKAEETSGKKDKNDKEASTKKPVTTTKKETEKKPVITLPDPTVPLTTRPLPAVRKGYLQFTTYGYGHGVGMSQYGMQEMAKQGYSYTQILKHYYYSPDIKIINDPHMPKTAVYNKKTYSIKDYIGKTVRQEIGTSFKLDAIESQVIAAYTYAMRYGFNTRTGQHAFREDFDYRGTPIETAMNNVLGKYLDYKGKPAFCPYFSTSAGYTTCCSNVWGGKDYPYLMGHRKSPEDPGKRVYKISTDDFKSKINKYNSTVSPDKRIVLPPDPTKWVKILAHDKALNDNLGYISKIQIGNQVMSGDYFRRVIMGANVLRSHCFSLQFTTA